MQSEHFIISIYCCIDKLCQHYPPHLRPRGLAPKLSNGKIITMGTVGELLGYDITEKRLANRQAFDVLVGRDRFELSTNGL